MEKKALISILTKIYILLIYTEKEIHNKKIYLTEKSYLQNRNIFVCLFVRDTICLLIADELIFEKNYKIYFVWFK
jgi:hypothetical protein